MKTEITILNITSQCFDDSEKICDFWRFSDAFSFRSAFDCFRRLKKERNMQNNQSARPSYQI